MKVPPTPDIAVVREIAEFIAMRRPSIRPGASHAGDVDVTNARVRGELERQGYRASDKTVRRRLHALVDTGALIRDRFGGRDEYLIKHWSAARVDKVLGFVREAARMVSIGDVADGLHISWRSASGILQQCHREGRLEKPSSGAQGGLYGTPQARAYTGHPFDVPGHVRSPLLRMQQGVELVDRDVLLAGEKIAATSVPRYVWAFTGLPGPNPNVVAWLEQHGLAERYGDHGSRVRLTDAGKAQRVPVS